jgi:hypothetical protein
MRFRWSLVSLALVVALSVPCSVLAVGYERIEMTAGKETSNCQPRTTLAESLKKATFLDKYPAILDSTALAVKDLLAQFGLTDRKMQ